ncbi:hypothetical protein M431DRAFT_351547 [Trichoderma harzianum CBS 226.95]|uniref:Uncharacterized protein n=1 Tax=Trichoderma harzianum CBS 226.95 TaxID=983964 RepID=A0A2T4ALA5_TRIHA|nr:hypothetical protein M431DRAFT_351547 [Trichoderma harzianum CBS 226.95]PTB57856.1 hypothetical protein M431DRAFT_351547 [Trichoderma harzianum CBS 226.95]
MASLDLNRATHHPHSHHITILQSRRPSPASWQRLTNGPCHAARRLRLCLSPCFLPKLVPLELVLGGSFAAAAWCQNTSALGLGLDPFFRLQVRGKERGEARERETERGWRGRLPAHCTYRGLPVLEEVAVGGLPSWCFVHPMDPWMSFHLPG